jgi:CubicO group peptidase (beta-lactamase class C family)
VTRRCVVAIAIIAQALCAADTSGLNAAKLAQIPVRMKGFVNQGKAAGIVTLVMRHGVVAEFEAVGVLDLDTKAPIGKDSIFRIMSMTKPVTSVAMMMLMEEGRVALIDPVEKYLPDFRGQLVRGGTKPAHPVTIFDLLTHTSGVAAPKLAVPAKTLAEEVAGIAREPLDFQPGAQWRYRTEGIDTVGRIVEVVSGMPFERFVAERIFRPLGMVDSAFFPDPAKASRVATVYTEENGALRRAVSRDTLYPSPGQGMLSTAADMARFYQMMLNKGTLGGHRLLSAASAELMTTVHTGSMEAGFAPGMGFGLGWGVVKDAKGAFRLCSVGSYGHGGAYRTYGWVDPAKDMVRVIMLQRTNGGGDVADEINAFLAMAGAAIE